MHSFSTSSSTFSLNHLINCYRLMYFIIIKWLNISTIWIIAHDKWCELYRHNNKLLFYLFPFLLSIYLLLFWFFFFSSFFAPFIVFSFNSVWLRIDIKNYMDFCSFFFSITLYYCYCFTHFVSHFFFCFLFIIPSFFVVVYSSINILTFVQIELKMLFTSIIIYNEAERREKSNKI